MRLVRYTIIDTERALLSRFFLKAVKNCFRNEPNPTLKGNIVRHWKEGKGERNVLLSIMVQNQDSLAFWLAYIHILQRMGNGSKSDRAIVKNVFSSCF